VFDGRLFVFSLQRLDGLDDRFIGGFLTCEASTPSIHLEVSSGRRHSLNSARIFLNPSCLIGRSRTSRAKSSIVMRVIVFASPMAFVFLRSSSISLAKPTHRLGWLEMHARAPGHAGICTDLSDE